MTIESFTAGSSTVYPERIAAGNNEPDWLRAQRREAWEVYAATPEPTQRDEEWRRTDIRWLRWDQVAPAATSRPAAPPAARERLDALNPYATVAQLDGSSDCIQPPHEVNGVVAMGLSEAARERPELVRELLATRAVTPDRGKLQALNAALWGGGALVHVPPGVDLEQPILYVVSGDGAQVHPRLLVHVGAGARASVIEWWTSPPEGALRLANGVSELLVDHGASLSYTHVESWGAHVGGFLSQRAVVERDATLSATNVVLGGRFHKAKVEATMAGPGGSVRMNGIARMTGDQFVDHHTLQDHLASDSVSDLMYAGVLAGASRSVYAGTIIVAPHAQRSNAYQSNRNLLLESGPRADSIPQLEIMADDVRCTHGATTSTVDRGQLHYLRSRGLTTEQARGLIVDGYLEPVLERMPDSGTRAVVRELVHAKRTATDPTAR